MDEIYYYFNDTKFDILLSSETILKTPYTFNDGNIFEMDCIKIFYNLIKNTNKSCNIVDIGAQTGSYTLISKFLTNCNFYSFEPYIETYNILNKNLKINNINNVKTYNIALSDKKDTAELSLCKSHNGLHTLGNNVLRFNDIEKINVNTDTIDNLFYEQNIPVDFIKIDTEGYEYYILKGALKTINKYKPIILLEWYTDNMKQCNVTEDMLNKLLDDINYKKKINIDGENIIIVPN